MKKLTLAVAATLAVLSSSAFAKNVVLKPVNQNIETQACYVAATEGLAATRTLLFKNNLSYASFARTVTCNDMSLAKFAKTYQQQDEAKSDTVKQIALVAKNSNTASQLCLDAVVIGEDAARAKHDIYGSVLCNRQELSLFVSKFADQEVELLISED